MKLSSRLAAGAISVVAWALAVPPLHAEPSFVWGLLYDGGSSAPDFGTAALCDPAGNVIFGGESADGVAGLDQVIRKIDRAGGGALWTARYSAFDGNDMALTGLVWDPFGDILVGGYIRGCVG